MKKILLLVGLSAIFLTASCANSDTKTAQNQVVVTMDDLYKEYTSSVAATREKYQGKEIVVLGVAGRKFDPEIALKSDDKKYMYYDFRAAKPPGGLNCMVETGKGEKFAELKEGDTVAVKGVLNVTEGSLFLQPCSRDFRDKK